MEKLLISIRNFSYHWTVKQKNEKWAATEYKHKVNGFISGYVGMLVLIVWQIIMYFSGIESSQELPVGRDDPWWMQLIAGGIIFGLPWLLIGRYLLKKIEHIPIPIEYDHLKFNNHRLLFLGGFLFGWFLAIGVGMFLLSYLRGGELRILDLIIHEGRQNHTFKKDFGL
jgi:hypothetical protein